MTGRIHGKLIVNINLFTQSLCSLFCLHAHFYSGGNSGGAGGGGNRHPSVNRHSLSEIFGSVGFSKQLNIPKLMGKRT